MPDNRPTITGDKITLTPLQDNDRDYIINLADTPHNGFVKKKEVEEVLDKYQGKFWEVKYKGKRSGVIGYFQQDNRYLMEGLKDPKAKRIGFRASTESAELMMNHMFTFTDKIRVCARLRDKGIQFVCRRLRFNFLNRVGDIIIYEKEK